MGLLSYCCNIAHKSKISSHFLKKFKKNSSSRQIIEIFRGKAAKYFFHGIIAVYMTKQKFFSYHFLNFFPKKWILPVYHV